MKCESEIRDKIDELSNEMKNIRKNAHIDNYLIYGDEMNILGKHLNEISHLCWVIDEPVPKTIIDLR